MIKTIVSIAVTLGIIVGLSCFEAWYIQSTFSQFSVLLESLYNKTILGVATKQDGFVAQEFWEEKKHALHIWIPHSAVIEINYQLDEAVGSLTSKDYTNTLAKLEVLLSMCEDVPMSYTFGWENIL